MSKKKIYNLKPEQICFFDEFKNIGTKRSNEMLLRMTKFIKKTFKEKGKQKAVVGLSGGADSALVAYLCVQALGKENVVAVKMPYRGLSSNSSIIDADLVIKALEIPSENVSEIGINRSSDANVAELMECGFKLEDVDIGNIMARSRMIKLFAIARRIGLVVDTCNKTEIKLGYLTIGGDGLSNLNPVYSVYKTWVWELLKATKIIPLKIVEKPASAELAKGQTDEDDLGISYYAVDLLLWLYFDKKVSEEDLTAKYYYPKEIVRMVLDRVKKNKFKDEPIPLCKMTFKKIPGKAARRMS